LPLSVRTRVSFKPFVGFTQYVDRGNVFPQNVAPEFLPSQHQVYSGARAEVVYDNSLTTGMNIIEGTRGKFSVVHYKAIGNGAKSFSQASLDIRHYQKIYREIVLAVRGFTGTFFGNSPKKYLLGGMDNWAFKTRYEALQAHTTKTYFSRNLPQAFVVLIMQPCMAIV
jgi:hypothetical protein